MKSYEDGENLQELLNKLPEEGTALVISKEMTSQGIPSIVLENKKSFTDYVMLNRKHRFNNLTTFLKYIGKYKSDETVLYYDEQSSLVHCVLNEKVTKGYPEQLDCVIDNKSLFNEIKKIESITNGAEFLHYIKNNKKNIESFLNLFHLMSAIKVCSSIEKLDKQGKNSEYNFVIKSEVKGQVNGKPEELPDRLAITFFDYTMDFNSPTIYLITADIYYLVTKESQLVIEIKVNNKEELKNELNKNFYNFVNDQAPTDVLVTIGCPGYKRQERE